MKNRKGLAVVIVIFFAFAIGIIMFAMFNSNTNLTNQTKQTIYQMQAYYLAQSGMQFAKLHIYLLPKEIYNFYGNTTDQNVGNALDKCESRLFQCLSMDNKNDKYDLFTNGKSPDEDFPYKGEFKVKNLKYLLSNNNMKMVQDSYQIIVSSKIDHESKDKKFQDEIEEQFVVSRSTRR